MAKKHWAIYGSIKMLRVYCLKCKGMTLVRDGMKLCCDRPIEEKPTTKIRRMIEGGQRKRPTKEVQNKILELQNNRCLYCGELFGTPYMRNNKILYTKLHFDHLIPYSYSLENKYNFVGTCNICNGIKSNKMFDTVEEVYHYVIYTRKKKGIEFIK